MGNAVDKINAAESKPKDVKTEQNKESEKKLKPCCACPETKRVRDECVIQKGEENCGPEIEAHKKCMRDMGFKI